MNLLSENPAASTRDVMAGASRHDSRRAVRLGVRIAREALDCLPETERIDVEAALQVATAWAEDRADLAAVEAARTAVFRVIGRFDGASYESFVASYAAQAAYETLSVAYEGAYNAAYPDEAAVVADGGSVGEPNLILVYAAKSLCARRRGTASLRATDTDDEIAEQRRLLALAGT